MLSQKMEKMHAMVLQVITTDNESEFAYHKCRPRCMKQKIILCIHIVQGKKDGLNIQIKYTDNIFLNKVVLTSY